VTLSGSTGPGAVVVVVLVVVEFVVGAGEVAALEVEAWTSRRLLSLLVAGPVGSGGVAGLVFVSARGAFRVESTGLELGVGEGELVCAFTTVRAVKNAAPAQRKIVRRLGIDDVKLKNAAVLKAGSRPALLRLFAAPLRGTAAPQLARAAAMKSRIRP
jgi:hypothetical protein